MRRRTWAATGASILVVSAAVGGVVDLSGANQPSSAAEKSPETATVERGALSDMVSLDGTLTYRARADGSAYSVVNRARGTYTELPETGDKVGCGGVLYRVDDRPVLLLCGAMPAYRDLNLGDRGRDVRQLNRNLHELGRDRAAGVELAPDDDRFTSRTQQALSGLQHARGLDETGELAADGAVFLPRAVRILQVTGILGGPARPGAPVALATSDTQEVRVVLDASQQGEVKRGDLARITLPGNTSVTGKVDRVGRVAHASGQNSDAAPTIPAYISLDHAKTARRLDAAPVQVEITTRGVDSALSVPVTALVGKSGGGFAVEVVRDDGRRGLVAVKVGLFDSTAGRVQVEGDLHQGDDVVVPTP